MNQHIYGKSQSMEITCFGWDLGIPSCTSDDCGKLYHTVYKNKYIYIALYFTGKLLICPGFTLILLVRTSTKGLMQRRGRDETRVTPFDIQAALNQLTGRNP